MLEQEMMMKMEKLKAETECEQMEWVQGVVEL